MILAFLIDELDFTNADVAVDTGAVFGGRGGGALEWATNGGGLLEEAASAGSIHLLYHLCPTTGRENCRLWR